MKSSTKSYLEEFDVYPSFEVINEASNYAQEKATVYAHSIDPDADITVDEADVYVKSEVLDEEQVLNVQVTFSEAFSEKIEELHKFEIRENAEQVLRENFSANTDDEVTLSEYVKNESESDPNFFRWLFNEVGNDRLSDFQCPDRAKFESFLNKLH